MSDLSTVTDHYSTGGLLERYRGVVDILALHSLMPQESLFLEHTEQRADSGVLVLSWEVFDANTDYFDPSVFPLMINLRVRDLDAVRERLADDETVIVDPDVQEFEYGRFGWIVDPAGIRIELWGPRDAAFD